MTHFIMKCMSITLPTMAILQQQGHATTNLCRAVVELCRRYNIFTNVPTREAAEDGQRQDIRCGNGLELGTQTQTSRFFIRHTIVYCKIKKWPATMSELKPTLINPSHWINVYSFRYHSHIPQTYTTNVFHSHRKQEIGLKWASQLITQTWNLIYGQWIHHSKPKHAGEAL